MEQTSFTERLMEFGLTRQEASIYQCLLTEGKVTGYEVAKQTGISRSNAYNSLASMIEKGAAYLVEEASTRKYVPVPLNEFCKNRVRKLEESARWLQEHMPSEKAYAEGYITIEGAENILNKIKNLLSQVDQRVYISCTRNYLLLLIRELDALMEARKKVVIITDQPATFRNATQVNTITTSIDSALISYNVIDDAQISMVNLVIGIVIAALVAVVLLGGVKRIGTVTEKLVPFMAVFYIILAIGVVALNADKVPHVFEMIFVGAFNPSAFTGGVVGSMFMTMRRGVSRGIFSNEAGIGTGSIAHACADTDEPVKQGMFGIFEVFADTIVICTLTALVILCGGEGIQYGVAAGAELTISGFVTTYGSWVTIFTAIAMCCFAFSTILGWGLYGARCVEFVFTTKVVKPFMIVYALVAILGATVDLGIIWGIADTCNGLMSIPNLIALFLLSGTVAKLVKDYFAKQEKKN